MHHIHTHALKIVTGINFLGLAFPVSPDELCAFTLAQVVTVHAVSVSVEAVAITIAAPSDQLEPFLLRVNHLTAVLSRRMPRSRRPPRARPPRCISIPSSTDRRRTRRGPHAHHQTRRVYVREFGFQIFFLARVSVPVRVRNWRPRLRLREPRRL